jgi:hypothetical protein
LYTGLIDREIKRKDAKMSDRITDKMLQSLTDHLNKITNSPTESYSKGEDDRYHANPGAFCLDGAYSGVQLQRICNEGGGYGTKRELYEKLHAYIRGIEEGKSSK